MPFTAGAFAAWLSNLLMDAGKRKLTSLLLGSEQERALAQAAAVAIDGMAMELRPGNAAERQELAIVVREVFRQPMPDSFPRQQQTLLEALEAGISSQLAVLHDPWLTGTRQSSAELLGITAEELARKLTEHLLRQIVAHGLEGGALFPLASQLNDDLTHLQGQRLEVMVGQLAGGLQNVLASLAEIRAAQVPAAAQLPPAPAGFTGRQPELDILSQILDPANPSAPAAAAIAGLAGIGKTALAVAAGYAANSRDWFPGGILFLNLHGYDDTPMEAGHALDTLLRGLGVISEAIPPGVEERAALYRSMLAQTTDRVLLIADNASSEEQVQLLMPGLGPHRVIVTSRHTLAGLDARLIDLDVLHDDEAVDLLAIALRAGRPADDRITNAAQAAVQLARACGNLPLALRIAGALMKSDPELSASDLSAELHAESTRLTRLTYGESSRSDGLSVAAAIEASVRRLSDATGRMLRLLTVNAGPSVSVGAASAISDLPLVEARAEISNLLRAHLLQPALGASRWQMHDLVRLYAQQRSEQCADADGRDRARSRLLGYYLRLASASRVRLEALPETSAPETFASRDEALKWMDAERENLVAAIQTAADAGEDRTAVGLAFATAAHLNWRRRFDDLLTVARASLVAARRLGDAQSEGMAQINIGVALTGTRHFEEAIAACRDAITILRETGDQRRIAGAHMNLSFNLMNAGRFEEAVTACRQAASGFQAARDRHGEGMALGNLGLALQQLRRFDEAIPIHHRDLEICQEIGDRHGEGMALNNLGTALQGVRRFEEAIALHRDAAIIVRETGDRHGEGEAQLNLGVALLTERRFDEAIIACQEAVDSFRETGDQHGTGMALNNLSEVLRHARRFDEAIAASREAVANFRDAGDQGAEADAMDNLGNALQEAGQTGQAMSAYQDAAALFLRAGDQHGEARALAHLHGADARRAPEL